MRKTYFFDKKLANVIKVSTAILNLVRYSVFDRRESAEPKKINISLLSGMAVAYEHCATIKHKN